MGDDWLNQIIGKIPADEVAEERQFAAAATRQALLPQSAPASGPAAPR
ncbi:MAG TPA: hypothetical protein VFJ07_05485 [Streptosporangiaceae bacterium]|nr:hypothetical protein [Streptosporangiaceae bacterium]